MLYSRTMLSVVVVGRNDSHGYNLSKRAATSLNSIALPMTGSDELIFIDWNTPDLNPTFIDAIRDTLTNQTLKYLKVYRVRPSVHKHLSNGSTRPILEPIARNVGIRRASNSWILSTNTDMIFDTHGREYKDILLTLKPNLYHLFRFEIPEFIWDQFNRFQPDETLKQINEIFANQGLVSRILTKPYETYSNLFPDAVGDFQLATSDIWDKVRGFPENMLRGWHVDSRLSVQIENICNLNSEIIDSDLISGYHQNHLRVLTHFHSLNDINPLETIAKPYQNHINWGLNELSLENSLAERFSINNLKIPLEAQERKDSDIDLLQNSLNSPLYDLELVLTFLLDDIINLPRGSKIGVSSSNANICRAIEFKLEKFEIPKDYFIFQLIQDDYGTENFDLVILDFGIAYEMIFIHSQQIMAEVFEEILEQNINILRKLPSKKRVVAIKAQHWSIRGLMFEYCSVPLFNNYSSLLSGIVTKKEIGIFSKITRSLRNYIRKTLYMRYLPLSLSEEHRIIMKDISLVGDNSHQFKLNEFETLFLVKVYKKIPMIVRKFINPKIRQFLRAI